MRGVVILKLIILRLMITMVWELVLNHIPVVVAVVDIIHLMSFHLHLTIARGGSSFKRIHLCMITIYTMRPRRVCILVHRIFMRMEMQL